MSVICVYSDEGDVGRKPQPCRIMASLAAHKNTQICIVQPRGHSVQRGQRNDNCEMIASRTCPSLRSPIDHSEIEGTVPVQRSRSDHGRNRKRRTPVVTENNCLDFFFFYGGAALEGRKH